MALKIFGVRGQACLDIDIVAETITTVEYLKYVCCNHQTIWARIILLFHLTQFETNWNNSCKNVMSV